VSATEPQVTTRPSVIKSAKAVSALMGQIGKISRLAILSDIAWALDLALPILEEAGADEAIERIYARFAKPAYEYPKGIALEKVED
jgi:hypothetical protein